MILGILADTHNRIDAIRAGMDALKAAGAEFYIHCGDVGEEAILDQLAGVPNAVVWGNNDLDHTRLGAHAASIGVNIHHPWAHLELDGKKIVVTHGDDGRILRTVLRENTVDYLFFGHTHVAMDERHGQIRVINPGALYRATPKTVAVLDLQTDELQVIPVKV